MTETEKEELKKLLLDMVEENRKGGFFKILDDDIRLDEDRGWCTTEAEILVFGLPRKYLPELHIAWDGYEVLIGIVSNVLPPRMEELIIKARGICPPAERRKITYEFMECLDFPDWFAWFAKEFFKIPQRGAGAFWHKQYFNTEHFMNFEDGEEQGLLYDATPKPQLERQGSRAYKRGAYPEEKQEILDNPVMVTVFLEKREYEFFKNLCGHDSFFCSVQIGFALLIRGCARDGLDLDFLQDLADHNIREGLAKPIEKEQRTSYPKDEIPF